MTKTDPIKILFLDDDANDVDLIMHELKRAGWNVEGRRVDTKEAFFRALSEQKPRIILSDHGLPQFDGFTALTWCRQLIPEIPFVFVSGTMDERTIVATIKKGATDFVSKHRLSELPEVFEDALHECGKTGTWIPQEPVSCPDDEAEENHALLPMCAACKRIRDDNNDWQPVEVYLREHHQQTVTHGICPECYQRLYPDLPPLEIIIRNSLLPKKEES